MFKKKSLINEAPFVIFLLNLPPNSHLRGRLSIENHVILVPLDKPENQDDRRKLKETWSDIEIACSALSIKEIYIDSLARKFNFQLSLFLTVK
jgi:hypothetical protein